MIVILPSQFYGGAARLSYNDQSTVYSAKRLYQTFVMAWYKGVQPHFEPITSGYRFALVYGLYHATHSLRPTLPDKTAIARRLQDVFRQWAQGRAGPSKIVYLLKHQYNEMGVHADTLEGIDATLLAALRGPAKDQGIHLGFASAVCRVSGPAGVPSAHRRGRDDDSSVGVDMDEVDMVHVESTSTSLNKLGDLEGTAIDEHVDFEVAQEAIPADLAEVLQDGDVYDQAYDRDHRDPVRISPCSTGVITV